MKSKEMIISVILILISVLILTACGKTTQDTLKPKSAVKPSKVWSVNVGASSGFQPVLEQNSLIVANIDGLLQSINVANGDSQWKYNIGNRISSKPLIESGVIYFGNEQGMNAVNLRDGKEKWAYTPTDPIYGKPVSYNGSIVFTDSDKGLFKVDSQTGTLKWKYITTENTSSGVKIDKDIAYFGDFKSLYAIDLSTQKEKYKKLFDAGHVVSVEALENNHLFVVTGPIVYCLDATDGKELWRYDAKLVVSELVINDNRLFFSNFKGKIFCLDVNNGKEVWSKDISGDAITSTPIVRENEVYIGINNYLYALDAKTGENIWSYQGEGKINMTPILFENKVAFSDRSGNVTLLELK